MSTFNTLVFKMLCALSGVFGILRGFQLIKKLTCDILLKFYMNYMSNMLVTYGNVYVCRQILIEE